MITFFHRFFSCLPAKTAILLCVFFSCSSYGDTLEKYVFKGLERIEPSTVKAYLDIHPGQEMTKDRLNDALKSLYKTGFFSNVSLKPDGQTLIITVEENPIINRVAFEGNSKLSDEALSKDVKLAPRTVYSPAKIQELQQKILRIYRLSGRFNATVEPKIIKQPENRVDVVFEIKEGPSTYVEKIIFQGNKRFSDATLEGVVHTKESRWYRFMTNDDTYDPDRVAYDQALLRQFYMDHGYVDFKIKSVLTELSENKKDFYITYVLDEGKRFKVGTLKVDNPLKDVSDEKIQEAITLETGEWYDATKLEDSLEAISQVCGDAGYAFVDPEPDIIRDQENDTVNVVFKIRQGPKVYVERIDIEGNTRTRDDIIRREFRLAEGDPFNATKIRRTEQRLRNLNFFKTVRITQEQGSDPDKVILKTEVEEQVTGEIQFAVSYGTQQGMGADITINERNLMGKGQDVSLRLKWSQRSQGAEFSFVEPYFLDRDLMAGFSVSAFKALEKENGVKDSTVGGRTWIGYEINEHLSQRLFYGLNHQETSFSARTSDFIKEQPKRALNSSVGVSTTYDHRDSSVEPRSGYILSMGNEFTGVGGSSRYFRNTASAAQYFPLWKESTVAFMANGGIISPVGRIVRTTDRFELGGFSFRGFDYGGIGPRDKRGEKDALGGLKYYTLTSEMMFPVGLPKEFGLMGSTFFEAGSLWGAQKSDPNLYDKNFMRYSVGVGINWASPMGPIRLDLARPLKAGKFDKKREFLFGFTTRF